MARSTVRKKPPCGPIDVPGTWKRIRAWLARHAPELADNLAPGAKEKDIKALEKLIGRSLPEEVRQSFLTHNGLRENPPFTARRRMPTGERSVFHALDFLSLDQISCVFDGSRELLKYRGIDDLNESARETGSSFPPGAINLGYINLNWIALATMGQFSLLAMDFDPGRKGILGQIINYGRDEERKCVVAWSWGWFLHDLLEELEQGNFRPNPLGPGLAHRYTPADYPDFWNGMRKWAKAKNGGRRPLDVSAPLGNRTGTAAVQLARSIKKDRAFDRLPILADALEEAGCTDKEILSHCRKPGEHLHGCWLVDMLLNPPETPQPTATARTASTKAAAKRRFEFSEGKSNKFWEISVKGSDVTVRFGRIGTEGQTQAKTFSDTAAAQKHADKLVGEKVGKGYREQPVSTSQSRSPAR